MLVSRIFCLSIALLIANLEGFDLHGQVSKDKERATAENLILRYHHFNRAEKDRLLGLLENNIQKNDIKDPFAAPGIETSGAESNNKGTLWDGLSTLGFSFDESILDPAVDYDGEQFFVHATPEAHQKLIDFFNQFREPNQVRISYWLEHETIDPASGSPRIKTYAPMSVITRSGRRSQTNSGTGKFSCTVTPTIKTHGQTVLISEIKFSADDGAQIELSSEYTVLASTKTEIAAITFDTEEADSTPKTRNAYRVYSTVDLIGPEGDIRPLDDSLIERLNLPDTFKYERCAFPFSRAVGMEICGPNFLSDTDASLLEFFESKDIQFDPNEGTSFKYDPKKKELTIRHTPQALDVIRQTIANHHRRYDIQTSWNIKSEAHGADAFSRESLTIRARTLSGKRIAIKHTNSADEKTKGIHLVGTHNLENDGSITKISELQLTNYSHLPNFSASFEKCLFQDTEATVFAFQRVSNTDRSNESIQLTTSSTTNRIEKSSPELITKFYPIHQGTVIRLTGFRGSRNSNKVVDPFATDKEAQASNQNEEVNGIIRMFESAGIDFSNVPDAELVFDGEQLIIRQTKDAQARITNILGNYNEVRRNLVHASFVDPDNTPVGSFSTSTRSGKRADFKLAWSDPELPDFSCKLTHNAEMTMAHNTIELATTGSLFPTISAIEISTEFDTPYNKPIQLSSMLTDEGEAAKVMITVTPVE